MKLTEENIGNMHDKICISQSELEIKNDNALHYKCENVLMKGEIKTRAKKIEELRRKCSKKEEIMKKAKE